MMWRAKCGVDGSCWSVESDVNPAPSGSFCPDCRAQKLAAPGVLNWRSDDERKKETQHLLRCRHDPRWAAEEILRLREIVWLYADPQQMKPEHKAFVETLYDGEDE